MSYILNCFVLGEDPFEKIFQFDLDTSKIQTIGLLKNAIITSQKLNVATKEVKLWSVDFPLTGVKEEQKLDLINKCTNVNINIRDELSGVELPTISMSNNEFVTQKNLQHILSYNFPPVSETHSRSHRVIFTNNTEYLLILVLFFPASYRQTRPKNTFMLS